MRWAGLIALSVAFTACSKREPLPILGAVPAFHLTAQSGQPFDGASLDGHIWVADFIFTTCTGPCPMMTSKMRQVQDSTRDLPDVRLISMTVDPAHDSPPVLAEFARHFKPDPARWFFLTGDPAVLNDLGLKAFKLNSVDGSLTHSTRFVLVDGKRRIRGYYSFDDDGIVGKLVADLKSLHTEL